MFLKVIAIIAFIGACQAAEHTYSSQSITHFDIGHDHHDGHAHEEHQKEDDKKLDDHKAENKVTHETEHKIVHPVEHHGIVVPHGNIAQHHEHKENKPHHDLSLSEHKDEHKVEHKVEHKIEHKNEHKVESKKENKVESKKENLEKKQEEKKPEQDDHKKNLHTKVIPTVEPKEVNATTAPMKVIPVAQYVQKVADNHKAQEPATSYQHISRHDVPATPPKDFTDHSGTSKYEFAYEVKDPHTGDRKYQHETHDGQAVKGVYSLHQGDGSVRTVEYAADKYGGFSAAIKQTTKHVEEKTKH